MVWNGNMLQTSFFQVSGQGGFDELLGPCDKTLVNRKILGLASLPDGNGDCIGEVESVDGLAVSTAQVVTWPLIPLTLDWRLHPGR